MPGGSKNQLWQAIAIALFLSLISILIQPIGKVDRVWSDVVLTSEKSAASQKHLIVDIAPEDMARFKGPPLPRSVLAQTVTRLHESGAERVLIDLTLSDTLSSDVDAALIKAMSAFGPGRIALPEGSADKFKPSVTEVKLALLTDSDGWTRSVRTSRNTSGYNPATWLATGQLSKDAVKIDLRLDPSTIKRISLSRFLSSRPINLADYSITISPDQRVAPSRAQLPLAGGADRAGILALGSQSVSDGYQPLVKKLWLATISIALIFTLSGVLLATFLQRAHHLFIAGLVLTIAAVGLNISMVKIWGVQGYPILQFSCLLIGISTTIAHRLRLYQMIAGFLKGDLSPEEAWAWRAYQESRFPVILLNGLGAIRRMNPSAQALKTLMNDDFEEVFQAEFRPGLKKLALSDKTGLMRKFALERPNPSVAIIVLKDVTEAERQFDVLQKSQTEAIELAEAYEQKKIRAETASEQKSAFLANMSHELRTPLTAINGFSDIMDRELFGPLGDPRYKEFARNILSSGQHLLALINDILDLSKIEAGKMKLSLELVDIDDLISQSLRIVDGRAQDGDLRLIYENTNVPHLAADPRAVKQILLNLLTNAIKFTPEGGTVTVGVDARPAGLIIHVADSGIGIAPEDIERLAQPFEQVDNEYAKASGGTGLGLSLTKSLVELHGGAFKIQSVVGTGTRISFTLPNSPLVHKEPDMPALPKVSQVAELKSASA